MSDEQKERSELVAALRRVNPFGGYCEKPCKHPGHTTEHYRATAARYGLTKERDE